MFDKCPGAANIRTPIIEIKKCPECGEEVEIFSDEMKVNCPNCDFTIYNDIQSCVQWCKYAKECVGEELYNRLRKKKIAFLCIENSCRSQMAEALAKKFSKDSGFEFISIGTDQASEVDKMALEVLREENIVWNGKPKIVPDKEQIDIVVTMGCEVKCPVIHGAKRIDWTIPDPKGKDIENYRRTLSIIKEKIMELLKELE